MVTAGGSGGSLQAAPPAVGGAGAEEARAGAVARQADAERVPPGEKNTNPRQSLPSPTLNVLRSDRETEVTVTTAQVFLQ